jgi:hypothetical protein
MIPAGPEQDDAPDLPHDLRRAVDEAVEGAFSRPFPLDPLLGASISRLVSASSSLVKRHGSLLETSIVSALAADGRFAVGRNVAFPVTRAADREARAVMAEGGIAGEFLLDGDVVRSADIDIIAVDRVSETAYALAVRRGGGATEAPKRQLMERNTHAVGSLMRHYCALHGYAVRGVRVAVLDYYGRGGFPAHVRITGAELDGFFGVPVVATVEAMTQALLTGYAARVPALLDRAVPPQRGSLCAIRVAREPRPLDAGSLRRNRPI